MSADLTVRVTVEHAGTSCTSTIAAPAVADDIVTAFAHLLRGVQFDDAVVFHSLAGVAADHGYVVSAEGIEVGVEQYRSWLRWIIENLNYPCRYDHADKCQAHFLDERPCPVEAIREELTS